MAPHQSRVSCGPESVWPADRDSGSRSCGHCRSPQTLIWCPEEERGEERREGEKGERRREQLFVECIMDILCCAHVLSNCTQNLAVAVMSISVFLVYTLSYLYFSISSFPLPSLLLPFPLPPVSSSSLPLSSLPPSLPHLAVYLLPRWLSPRTLSLMSPER